MARFAAEFLIPSRLLDRLAAVVTRPHCRRRDEMRSSMPRVAAESLVGSRILHKFAAIPTRPRWARDNIESSELAIRPGDVCRRLQNLRPFRRHVTIVICPLFAGGLTRFVSAYMTRQIRVIRAEGAPSA